MMNMTNNNELYLEESNMKRKEEAENEEIKTLKIKRIILNKLYKKSIV